MSWKKNATRGCLHILFLRKFNAQTYKCKHNSRRWNGEKKINSNVFSSLQLAASPDCSGNEHISHHEMNNEFHAPRRAETCDHYSRRVLRAFSFSVKTKNTISQSANQSVSQSYGHKNAIFFVTQANSIKSAPGYACGHARKRKTNSSKCSKRNETNRNRLLNIDERTKTINNMLTRQSSRCAAAAKQSINHSVAGIGVENDNCVNGLRAISFLFIFTECIRIEMLFSRRELQFAMTHATSCNVKLHWRRQIWILSISRVCVFVSHTILTCDKSVIASGPILNEIDFIEPFPVLRLPSDWHRLPMPLLCQRRHLHPFVTNFNGIDFFVSSWFLLLFLLHCK